MWGIVSNEVYEFGASQIASGTVTPSHQFSIAATNFPLNSSMAFDRTGNLWIGEANFTVNGNGNYSGQIIEFTAAQLAALATTPNPTPHATLMIAGAVDGLAFDASGSLWASVFAFSGSQLMQFTSAQLSAGSGSPTPAVVVSVQVQGAIAFASDGTLWLANTIVFGPSDGLLEGFAPSQLTASGGQTAQYVLAPAGNLVIAGQAAVVATPNQLGFDAAGNLWSVFDGYTFAFAASSLHSTNASTMTSFQGYPAQNDPGGQSIIYIGYALGFDAAFDLIENSSANALHAYTPSQYASGATFTSATLAASAPSSGGFSGNFLIAGPYVP